MIYVPLNNAQPGMKLAKSIPSSIGYFSLLKNGEVLTSSLIEKLREHGIDGVYVELAGSEDIEPSCIMEPEVRQQITNEFRTLYTDYLTRPAISYKAVEATKKIAENIVDQVLGRDEYLVDIMEIKGYDSYTYSHSLNVGILSILLANEMGITRNRLEDIGLCALMHDIGKVGIKDSILQKPGPLTDDEWLEMRTHPEIGYRIALGNMDLAPIAEYILAHHERWDGAGYPRGLSREEIPMLSRILSVVDAFDAMTNTRVYRQAVSRPEAAEEIMKNAGTQFDPKVARVFIQDVLAMQWKA